MAHADLHQHTEYSNLRLKDSTIHIKDLLEQCKKFNITNVAITDHEALTGHVDFLEEVEQFNKNNSDNKIKPILGNETYIVEENASLKEQAHYQGRIYGHLILLAKNKNGHKQLRELSSIAWENGFYRGKYFTVCVDYETMKKIIKKGDVICSTACLGGLLPHYVLGMYQAFKDKNAELANKYNLKIKNYIKDYQDLFGKDNFYIELQPNEPNTTQWLFNKMAIKIAEKYKVPFIITNDAHYLRPENAKAHEAFLKSSENDQREVSAFYKYTYLMSDEEIINMMKDNIGYENVIKAFDNTNKIANMIEIYDLRMPTQMPIIDLPKTELVGIFNKYLSYYNDQEYKGIKYFLESNNKYNKAVMYYVEQGFVKKIINHTHKSKKIKKYIEEINEDLEVLQELETVHNKNFSQYFLVTKKIVDLIWKAGSFVGIARGSAGAFIINYLMDIVDVDAVEANFPYWRFLAKGRIDNPDCKIIGMC